MKPSTRAIFFLEEGNNPDAPKSLMLESVLFCPVLTWVGRILQAQGVERFFVVCGDKWTPEVKSCFCETMDVTISSDAVELYRFLDTEETAMVFHTPVIPVAVDNTQASVYTADTADLRNGWSNTEELTTKELVQGYTAVTSLPQLQWLQTACRDAVVMGHLARGVQMLDPATAYIDPRVEIGAGTMLLPNTILRGNTKIGMGCTIGPNSMVRDCIVGDNTEINASQANESTIGSDTHVGPFAYLRPNCTVGDHVKVGDFVEVKNSVLGNGTKISHLTYVGDSDVGAGVNFGCGTVTTNYDGFKKYRCTIEDGAFIGCNTNLVAPVTVGAGSYIAAGATITKDVPKDALALARVQQVNRLEWAAKRRSMNKN